MADVESHIAHRLDVSGIDLLMVAGVPKDTITAADAFDALSGLALCVLVLKDGYVILGRATTSAAAQERALASAQVWMFNKEITHVGH